MIKYFNFLFLILIKKKSLYIIFALFCLVFTGIFIAGMNSFKNSKSQLLFPITTFIKYYPFIFSTIFILIGAIRIFKITERDGTELLVSAKPLSRTQIILAKFFVLLVLIIIFQVLLFLFLLSIAQADNKATNQEKLRFAATLTIGGLITSLIMTSIIIIISSLMGQIGTIVLSILFVTCVPILSFVIVPFSTAISPIVGRNEIAYNYLSKTVKTDDIYNPQQQTTKLSKINFLPHVDKYYMERNRTSWYQQVKYLDVWYQWNRFYSLMEPKVVKTTQWVYSIKHFNYKILNEQEFNAIYNKSKQTSIGFYQMPPSGVPTKDKELLGFFSNDEVAFEKQSLSQVFNKIKYNELTKQGGSLAYELKKLDDDFKAKYRFFEHQSVTAKNPLNKEMTTFFTKRLQSIFGLKKAISFKNYRILLWRAIYDFQSNILETRNSNHYNLLNFYSAHKLFHILFKSEAYGQSVIYANSYFDKTTNKISFEKLSQDYFIVSDLKKKNFLDTNIVIAFWSAIGFILLMTSTVIYSRRDFR